MKKRKYTEVGLAWQLKRNKLIYQFFVKDLCRGPLRTLCFWFHSLPWQTEMQVTVETVVFSMTSGVELFHPLRISSPKGLLPLSGQYSSVLCGANWGIQPDSLSEWLCEQSKPQTQVWQLQWKIQVSVCTRCWSWGRVSSYRWCCNKAASLRKERQCSSIADTTLCGDHTLWHIWKSKGQ